jgi:hypothetical protein
MRERPNGKDVQVGDSLRLRKDTTLLPCPLTNKLLVESNFPSSNLSNQRKEIRNNIIGEAEINTQNLQTSKRF